MLKAAINYEDKLNKKLAEKAISGGCLGLGMMGYNSLTKKLKTDTWQNIQYVSVAGKKVLGYINLIRLNPGNRIDNIIIIGFAVSAAENITFGRDCYDAIKKAFKIFNVDSIHWTCLVGSDVEKHYDSFCKQAGGRIVGIKKRAGVDERNDYRDIKIYEIMKEDFKGGTK